MLQRLIFAFSLIVSFGFAQFGAISHEISHYHNIVAQQENGSAASAAAFKATSAKPVGQKDALPHTQLCEKCVSYAGVTPLFYQLADLVFDSANTLQFASLNHSSFVQRFNPQYAARAPPTYA